MMRAYSRGENQLSFRLSHAIVLCDLMLLVLLLFSIVPHGKAATDCLSTAQPVDVNETSPVGYVIDTLNATYLTTLNVDSRYLCYFELVSSQLRLKKQFDLENFTSCLDGTTIPSTSVPITIDARIPCVDGITTATFLIRLVDINEFPPTFIPNSFRLNVSEESSVGSLVTQLSTFVVDMDRSSHRNFNILIANGSLNDFGMNDGVTSGILRVTRTLDYDAGTRQYIMTISASDLSSESSSLPMPLTGYATLTINILDFDDKNPYFLQNPYNFYIMENDTSLVDRPLRTNPPIEARDGDIGINQTVNYAIDSAYWSIGKGNLIGNATFLTINSTNGQFTLLTLVDRELLPSSTLLVQVRAYQTDKSDTRIGMTLVIVTIGDKNDNAPVMDSAMYNVSIAENVLVGSYVTVVKATDADLAENATFVYLLNDTSGAFQINPATGHVTVLNAALLDREVKPMFVMTVLAQESLTPERYASQPSLLIVNLIDLNDNSPIFSPPNATYAFNVSAVAPAGTAVGTVVATDIDAGANGQVRFSIVWSSVGAATYFQLDAVTGAVTTLTGLSTATALPASFVIQVVAEDQASPAANRRQTRGIVEITVSPVETAAPSTSTSTTASSTSTIQAATTPTSEATPTTNAPTTTHVPSTTVRTLETTSTTVVTTIAPNTTFATIAATPLPVSSDAQLALIIVCALLFILVLVLVGMLIYCWSARRHLLVQEKQPESDLVQSSNDEPEMQERPRAAQVVETEAVNPNEQQEVLCDNHSQSVLALPRIMFEPAPYQSLSFSLVVPDLPFVEDRTDGAYLAVDFDGEDAADVEPRTPI